MTAPAWSPQQNEVLSKAGAWLRMRYQPTFYLAGYAGTGKEQPVSCMVQTPTGPQRIGDLKPGDLVLGRDGRPTHVLGVYPQGRKPVFRVTFRDGSSTRCGVEHLWQVRSGARGWRVMSLRQILAAGVRWDSGDARFQIPLCEPVQYDLPRPAFDPYLIGVLLGDGCLNGNIVLFSTPDIDADIVELVRECLPADFDMRRDDCPSCPRYIIKDTTDCHHNRLRFHLNSLGLCVKSPEKFIPEQYLYAPVDCRLALLRGLMDTDGSSAGNRVGFHTSSSRLARDFVALVQSLGGAAITKSYSRYGTTEFQINVKTAFNPFLSRRKGANYRPSAKNPPSRYIWSVEEEGEEEQVCIKVAAGDELYLTDDFIVTHNTTIATHVAQHEKGEVRFAAFTGKASRVMRQKGCAGARTIHSTIYHTEVDPTTGVVTSTLDPLALDGVSLVVVDEVSMVNEELGKDLLSFGVPVLVLGDPAQLPPVSGSGYFTSRDPDYMLTEVHRQAAESPILRLATDIREGRSYRPIDVPGLMICRRENLDQHHVTDADIVIVGRNDTRQKYNARLRQLKGFTDPNPMVGENLICLRNDSQKGIANGEIFTVKAKKRSKKVREHTVLQFTVADPDDQARPEVDVAVRPEFFRPDNSAESLPWKELTGTQRFTFGLAITAHKAQGSQWPNVCVFDESSAFREDRRRWLYTAVTRAADNLTMVI